MKQWVTKEGTYEKGKGVLSDTEKGIIGFLKDIFLVSEACSTRTYIWAGLVPDIAEGHFIREHHDIDGFTIDLWRKRSILSEHYRSEGYNVTFLKDFHIMKIERNGLYASFNRLDIEKETAMWRHIGEDGTVYFPVKWLPDKPNEIHEVKAYISGMQFEYCIKKEPSLLSPLWKRRQKDAEALKWLEKELEKQGIEPTSLFDDIWSYNPFWAKQGYKEYERPIVIGNR
jgi:hypothetical protein